MRFYERGEIKMVNVNKLRGKIVERGKTVEEMASALNVVPSTIYRKLQTNGDAFTIKEADAIVRFLDLDAVEATSIFFSQYVA